MVFVKQLSPQHLNETEKDRHSSIIHQWGLRGESVKLPLPGRPHGRGLNPDHKHHSAAEKGPTETGLPENTQEKTHITHINYVQFVH